MSELVNVSHFPVGHTETIKRTFDYFAYGLNIRSEIRLPDMEHRAMADPANISTPDIEIYRDIISQWPELDALGNGFWGTENEACYVDLNVGAFLVRNGQEIIVDLTTNVEESVLMMYLLGPVLGMALHQRNCLLLHGSAIAVDDGAVVFLGNSGSGKSTTAAALYARGYPLISDEMIAIDMNGIDGPSIRPAVPRIKLCPKSASTIGYDPATLSAYHDYDIRSRRECVATDGFLDTNLPIRRIYVFKTNEQQRIEYLSAKEGMMELVKHAYPEFATLLEGTGPSAIRFHYRIQLAKAAPVCCLNRKFSLNALSDLVDLIEADFSKLMD
jgi:hypothetical protein